MCGLVDKCDFVNIKYCSKIQGDHVLKTSLQFYIIKMVNNPLLHSSLDSFS